MNVISMGSMTAPTSLNDVYNKANQRVELRGAPCRGDGASFGTIRTPKKIQIKEDTEKENQRIEIK